MRKKITRGFGLSLLIIFMMVAFSSSVLAVNSGWKDAESNHNNDGVQNADRAYTLNGQYANFNNDGDSVIYGFGNNLVPAGTVINGIEVRYNAYKNKESDRKLHFQLYEGNTARGNMIAGPNLQEDKNTDYIYLGSASNNWGYAGWDATKINNLRVKVSVNAIDGSSNNYLDHIQVRVNYSYVDYSITYNLNGGVNSASNPATYNASTPTINFADATKSGYTFGGWFSDAGLTNEVTSIPMGSTGNVTLYAKWIINNYNINYILNGGVNDIDNPATYNVTDPDITLDAATRVGYIFAGWFDNADFTGSAVTTIDTASAMDYTLYAKWIADDTGVLETYNINYILNGGVNDVDNPATYDSEDADIVLQAATRVGYTFAGWFDNADFTGTAVTTLDTAAEVDYTVYAKWVEIIVVPEVYTITYVLNGGVNNIGNPATYDNEDADIVLQAPTRVGYIFAGWFANADFTGTAVTVLDTAAEVDYTVYAKWIADDTGVLETYNIIYVLNGGVNNVGNPATYDTEDADIVLQAPTRVGYIFAGWFANADFTGTAVTVLDTAAEVDYTVYAKWIADDTGVLETYNIIYVLNGGVNNVGNPATYDTEDADIVLKAPTRAGYVFGGWFANANLTGTAITLLDTAGAVDYTVYAKWVAAPVTTVAALPQTGQFPVLIGAIGTILFTGVGLAVLNKKR